MKVSNRVQKKCRVARENEKLHLQISKYLDRDDNCRTLPGKADTKYTIQRKGYSSEEGSNRLYENNFT